MVWLLNLQLQPKLVSFKSYSLQEYRSVSNAHGVIVELFKKVLGTFLVIFFTGKVVKEGKSLLLDESWEK